MGKNLRKNIPIKQQNKRLNNISLLNFNLLENILNNKGTRRKYKKLKERKDVVMTKRSKMPYFLKKRIFC